MSGFDKEEVLSLIDKVELASADGTGPLGWVYFIICMDVDRCKIGFTKGDVYKRMKSLQTGSSSELILIAKHPGTPDTERRLHEKFASARLHGEWFELTNEIRAYMIQALWAMTEFAIKCGHKLEPWMLAGVQLTANELECCSEGLLEALRVPEE